MLIHFSNMYVHLWAPYLWTIHVYVSSNHCSSACYMCIKHVTALMVRVHVYVTL